MVIHYPYLRIALIITTATVMVKLVVLEIARSHGSPGKRRKVVRALESFRALRVLEGALYNTALI